MLQFVKLSAAGRNIVENYLSGSILSMDKKKEQLVVSLYSAKDDANPKVLDILKSYVVNLGGIFSEAENLILRKECNEVIRYCHERKEPDMGYTHKSDNHPLFIPKSVLDLCESILEFDQHPDSEVFLPYAGASQFAYLQPSCKYEGFELNPEAWAFSQIYLNSYGINTSIELTGDMDKALLKGKQYDYIFSFPPFLIGREARTVIDNLYLLATKSLKENGTMCCILPLSFCTASSGWFDLRKILLDYRNQYSAAVISLPRIVFPFATIETCLFILSKDNQGKVLLVDATSDKFCSQYDVAGTKEFDLKPLSILEAVTGTHPDERYVWGGDASQLVGDVNLLPSRYLIKNYLPQLKRGEQMMYMRELVDIVHTGKTDRFKEDCQLLGMMELSTNYLNCDITSKMIPLKPNHIFRTIESNCLLAGFIGGKFKVGRIVDLSGRNSIALRHEIIPFRLTSNVVSEDFLLKSILSEYMAQQAKMMSGGLTISRIKAQDFLDLKIIVPSLEEQERACKADTKQTLTEAANKQKETDDEFRRDMHMKKHAIGQTIFNLNNWWKTLQRARKEGDGVVDDNAVIGRSQKIVVKDIYDNIQQTIEQLQQQISKFDRGNGLVTENISLTKFIENYIAEHRSPIFRFAYDKADHYRNIMVDMEEVYDEKGRLIDIKGGREEEVTCENAVFAPEALTIIFDNIISNACSHGFVGREEKPDENIIRIELTTEGTDHIISISNNGMPVRDDVTENYVFRYNESTKHGKGHSGIGGYEVKHLMKEFDGDAEFISQPENEFPVTYKLIFHNTGIVQIDLFNTEE